MIEFRLAGENDIPALEKLIALSVYGLQATFYTRAQMEGAVGTVFAVDSQLIRDGTYFVATHDGKIVGCGGWSRRQTLYGGDKAKQSPDDPLLDPARDAVRIRAFFIDPAYARRGIGSEIVRRCESAAIDAGFSRAFIVATLSGEKLFERFGYAIVRRHSLTLPNHERLPVVEMEKKLSSASANQRSQNFPA